MVCSSFTIYYSPEGRNVWSYCILDNVVADFWVLLKLGTRKSFWMSNSKKIMFCTFDVGIILFKHKSLEEYMIRIDLILSGITVRIWHPPRFLVFQLKRREKKAVWPKSSSFSLLNLEWIFSKALEGIAYFLVC